MLMNNRCLKPLSDHHYPLYLKSATQLHLPWAHLTHQRSVFELDPVYLH